MAKRRKPDNKSEELSSGESSGPRGASDGETSEDRKKRERVRPGPAVGISGAGAYVKSDSATGILFIEDTGNAHGALVLPCRERAEEVGLSLDRLLDDTLCATATAEGAVNSVASCQRFSVVRTTPDGNCLSHACSLGIWGTRDADQQLRQAIAGTMQSAVAGAAARKRFEAAMVRLGIPQEEWDKEWQKEIDVFAGPLRGGRGSKTISRGFLSDIHCFVLASVLRRPLVIYGNPVALAAGLAGVYLPLLWGDPKRAACSRTPTSLLFHRAHFSVLATTECGCAQGEEAGAGPAGREGKSGGARGKPRAAAAAAAAAPARKGCGVGGDGHPPTTALPLAVQAFGGLQRLPVRFLLQEEEAREDQLLGAWMDILPEPLPEGVAAYLVPATVSGETCQRLADLSGTNRGKQGGKRDGEASGGAGAGAESAQRQAPAEPSGAAQPAPDRKGRGRGDASAASGKAGAAAGAAAISGGGDDCGVPSRRSVRLAGGAAADSNVSSGRRGEFDDEGDGGKKRPRLRK